MRSSRRPRLDQVVLLRNALDGGAALSVAVQGGSIPACDGFELTLVGTQGLIAVRPASPRNIQIADWAVSLTDERGGANQAGSSSRLGAGMGYRRVRRETRRVDVRRVRRRDHGLLLEGMAGSRRRSSVSPVARSGRAILPSRHAGAASLQAGRVCPNELCQVIPGRSVRPGVGHTRQPAAQLWVAARTRCLRIGLCRAARPDRAGGAV